MLAWAWTLFFAALLAFPQTQSLFALRWTPYSSPEFFLCLIPVFLLVGLLKSRFRSFEGWLIVVELLNFIYLSLIFPQPIVLAFAACWFYAVLSWCQRQRQHSFIQGLLLLLPLVLKHNVHELQFWGLSYATFRAFHLFMDDALLRELTPRRYFFFVFYFPTLLAGPIDRWPRFKEALQSAWARPIEQSWPEAFFWLALGLVQKFILAEGVHRYWLPAALDSAGSWVAAFYSYPLYLYLDFAGYSAMALGFSLLLGIRIPRNFDRPFLAQNPQDFWRRFHISLGEWLRDYFFKPLYRASARWPSLSPLARQNISLFLTFFLMGLWNGPRKPFLISGALFGIYSVVHNTYIFKMKSRGQAGSPSTLRVWLSRLLMLHLAALALLIFSGKPFEG